MRAVFFDLDGTLTDPKPGITQCIAHAMTKLGRTAPEPDSLRWCIGPPLRGSFARLLDTDDDAMLDRAIALYRERFGTVGLFENALYPGIADAIETVRAGGLATFVATSKPHVFATRIVAHFGLAPLFDHVYGSELDGTRVDKGELLAHARGAGARAGRCDHDRRPRARSDRRPPLRPARHRRHVWLRERGRAARARPGRDGACPARHPGAGARPPRLTVSGEAGPQATVRL